MPDSTVRPVNPSPGPGRVGFADGYPFLLTSTASLDELSRRGASVPMERFRPNIVVEGSLPFEEDGWKPEATTASLPRSSSLGSETARGDDRTRVARGGVEAHVLVIRKEPHMIEHVSLRTHDAKASRRFYERALKPLGYVCDMKYGDSFGFKDEAGRHDFWVTEGQVGTPTHLAFHAPSRKAIEEFHAAALNAGGKDNGEPGPREGYAAYAAFAFDPDGNNVEAVIWEGESGESKRTRRASASYPRRRSRSHQVAQAVVHPAQSHLSPNPRPPMKRAGRPWARRSTPPRTSGGCRGTR